MRIERIDTETMTMAIGLPDKGAPILVYLGAPLPADADLSAMPALNQDPRWGGLPDAPVGASFLPTSGTGFMGAPGLSVSGPDGPVVMDWRCREVTRQPCGGLAIAMQDSETGLDCALFLHVREGRDRLCWLDIGADRAKPGIRIDHAAFALPLPHWANAAITFAGRWAGEWRQQSRPITVGQHVAEVRGGRPGFAAPGSIILCAAATAEDDGPALSLHLHESGEPRTLLESFGEGGGQIQIGQRDSAGELSADAGFLTPRLALNFSSAGLNGLRAQARGSARAADLKVHLNSWEALYFDHDAQRLFALVAAAADLGAERFVLDDGWFKGRRHDRAGLGDWTPDPERFPDGLNPLIAHVHQCGMEFGLWVEPEMINPDSDLYRAHPDWALPAPLMRNQLALDLSKPDVRDFITNTLDRLLSDHPIAYIKWDHNRALFPLPLGETQSVCSELLQRAIKAKHPHVVFESCASGGARLHRGQLDWADRFWPSDNTDAHARASMIEALSQFLPLSTLGAHVGASPNPITGRRSDIGFRAKIALFGHMGVEADPAKMTASERDSLRAHIALYKRYRHLVADGIFRVGHGGDPGIHLWQITAQDCAEALVLLFRRDEAAQPFTPPTTLGGLDPDADYRVTLLEPWPKPAAGLMRNADAWRARPVLRGAVLMQHGLRLPLVHPETAWLVHLEKAA